MALSIWLALDSKGDMLYNLAMSGLLEKVAARLAKYSDKTVAVATSGGRDSVCLLHAVINCGTIDRSRIVAVHVNHNLRETAKRDEDFVRGFCERNGVIFRAYSVDVKKNSSENGLTIEQAARELRYGIFRELIKSGATDIVLTAHHAADNAESILMHLFRGSGLDGLRVMKSTEFVRPFIDVYPDELDEYVRDNSLEYVMDETNSEDDADRNFLRNNVIPLIEKRYKGAMRAVNALSRECDCVCGMLDGMLDDGLITLDGGAVVIDDKAFQNPALAGRYVRKAMSHFTLTDATRTVIERVIGLASARTGAIAELPFGVIAAREYGSVALYIPRESFVGEIPLDVGANFIDGLAVDVAPSKCDHKRAPRGSLIDLGVVDGAVIRFRRDGDMFTPFGGGRKKLKQFFIDRKIPSRLRDRIPLVCKGGEVLCVVGIEISDSVKITENTARAATVTMRWI